jgi:hypothetical protein
MIKGAGAKAWSIEPSNIKTMAAQQRKEQHQNK